MAQDWVQDDNDAFGGGAGLPVPSWDTLGKGGVIEGVILPQRHPKSGTLVSYISTQQTSMPTQQDPTPRPLWYDAEQTRPRMQAEYHVMTGFKDFEDCSDQRKAYAEENEEVDNSVRRVIVKGKTATNSQKKSASKVFRANGGRPLIGAYFRMELTGKKPIAGTSYKENLIDVSFRAPDAASLEIVRKYMEEEFPEELGGGDADDAFGAGANIEGASTSADDEPEF